MPVSFSNLPFLFLSAFSSSLGFPSGTLAMIAFGTMATDFPSLVLVILVAFLAVIIGDVIAYEIARRYSKNITTWLRKFSFFSASEPRARRLLISYGFYIVFFTRFFLVNLCAPISYISGLERFSRKKFLFAVFTGEFLYVVIYSSIGFLFGEIFNDTISLVNEIAIGLVFLVLIFSLVKFLVSRRKRKNRNRLDKI
jgi:membrane protein DedA with SNARE-associated domain